MEDKYIENQLKLDLINLYLTEDYNKVDVNHNIRFPKDFYLENETTLRIFVLIRELLKPKRKDYYLSQIIELSPIKGYNRNNFYNSLKRLNELNVLSKIAPKTYMINPYYINNMNKKQLEMFNYSMQDYYVALKLGAVNAE